MRIAQTLAGHPLAEADAGCKAVGKKDAELIRAEPAKFIEKSVEKPRSRDFHEEIASQIETPDGTPTNRTRSPSRSSQYHTAWLKTQSPLTSWRR